MRILRWLAISVGVLFVVGTALQLVDFFNLYATPPEVGPVNMVESRLAVQDYRMAIWPVFALGNFAFALGFVALAGLGLALAARLAGGDPQRIVILTSFAVAGVLGAVGQLILIGAAQVTVDTLYCDCGFKNEEIVSQIWGQMLIEGGTRWLVNAASVLAAIGIVGVDVAFRRRMPAAWDIVSWLTAIGLIVTVVVGFLAVEGDLPFYLQVLVAGVLVPAWAIWLGASLRDEPEPEPPVEAEPAPA
jgi:hypothetical protein